MGLPAPGHASEHTGTRTQANTPREIPSLIAPESGSAIEHDRPYEARIQSLLTVTKLDIASGENPDTIANNLREAIEYVKQTGLYTPNAIRKRRLMEGLEAIELLRQSGSILDADELDELADLESDWNSPNNYVSTGGTMIREYWSETIRQILPNHSLPRLTHTSYNTIEDREYIFPESDFDYNGRKYAQFESMQNKLQELKGQDSLQRARNREITVGINPYGQSSARAIALFEYAHTLTDDVDVKRELLQQSCGFIVHALEKPSQPDAKGFDAEDGINRYYAGRIMHDLAELPMAFSNHPSYNDVVTVEAQRKSIEWLIDARHILANATHHPLFDEPIGNITNPQTACIVTHELERSDAYDKTMWFISRYMHEYGTNQAYDVAAQLEELKPKVAHYIRMALGSLATNQNPEKDDALAVPASDVAITSAMKRIDYKETA